MGSKRESINSIMKLETYILASRGQSTDSYLIAHGESRGVRVLKLETLSDSERIYSTTPSDYLPITDTSFSWSHICDHNRMPVNMAPLCRPRHFP